MKIENRAKIDIIQISWKSVGLFILLEWNECSKANPLFLTFHCFDISEVVLQVKSTQILFRCLLNTKSLCLCLLPNWDLFRWRKLKFFSKNEFNSY